MNDFAYDLPLYLSGGKEVALTARHYLLDTGSEETSVSSDPPELMYPLILLVGGFAAAGLFLLIRAAISAPEAVEDEHGFRLTSSEEASVQPPPVFVDTADLAFFRR